MNAMKKSWLIALAFAVVGWVLVRERAPGSASWALMVLLRLIVVGLPLYFIARGVLMAYRYVLEIAYLFH